jgi:hypothetical protein
MTKTAYYSLDKASLGHSVRDVDIGANLDIIDTAIKARADSITALEALADGKIMVGDGDGAAADVAMSGHVTIVNTGATALKAALLKGIITAELSFESDRKTATKIYFPYAVTITKIRTIVMKALADTNAGTITGANSVGNSTDGVVTIDASALLNAEDEAEPSDNNEVAADSYYMLTSAKAAAGGIVLVTLEYIRTD